MEALEITFRDHAVRIETENKVQIQMYKERYPNSEIPEHFKETFNLSMALAHMARQIDILTVRLNDQIKKNEERIRQQQVDENTWTSNPL